MGTIVEVKPIFISGPSDAKNEMNLIKELIEILNIGLCPRFNIRLEPIMGSTHARAGVGRAQELINPLVEECDLFIGVFKKQFGTPTGEYKSGSEEEYRIAFRRNQDSKKEDHEGVPEIFVFFFRIPEIEEKDLEPLIIEQLQNLLEFKEDIRNNLLYKSYNNEKELIFECLIQVIQWLMRNISFKMEEK